MVIALILLIPVMCLITDYFTLRAFTIGFKHNWEAKNNIQPQQEKIISNPFETFREKKEENKTNNILNEWLNGKE